MFQINNYVLFKYMDEWQEGRIIDILQPEACNVQRTSYRILSLRVFKDLPVMIHDSVFPSSVENFRKFKIALYVDQNKLSFPAALKEILNKDKCLFQENKLVELPANPTVEKLIEDFLEFLQLNKPNISSEETLEVFCGFKTLFNHSLENILLYSTERKQFALLSKELKKNNFAQTYGKEHLLRMLYAIAVMLNNYVSDPETRGILLEYTTYFIDFFYLYKEKYFS